MYYLNDTLTHTLRAQYRENKRVVVSTTTTLSESHLRQERPQIHDQMQELSLCVCVCVCVCVCRLSTHRQSLSQQFVTYRVI